MDGATLVTAGDIRVMHGDIQATDGDIQVTAGVTRAGEVDTTHLIIRFTRQILKDIPMDNADRPVQI